MAAVNRHLVIFFFVSPLAILLGQDLAEPQVKTKDTFLTVDGARAGHCAPHAWPEFPVRLKSGK
ncbi:hypothetical protein C8J57DRAFT_1517406 [Mycena rebaudengoi]|nr:hypothetical protein C8J57DRAFT_1517406 [Mycena rebaudengoi]